MKRSRPPVWNDASGYPITAAARKLGISKLELHGCLMALGIEPTATPTGRCGMPPKILTGAQVADIARRIRKSDRMA
jgi:hypothetical protein